MKGNLSVQLPGHVDSLERLLFRCHRDELLPLAAALKVDARPFGLSDLAKLLSRTLRRACSHGGKNLLFRRGEGLRYEEILGELSGRVPQPDEVEEMESALLRDYVVQQWTGAERARIWAELGLDGAVPEEASTAISEAESRLGRGFIYRLSKVGARVSMPMGAVAVGAFVMSPVGCLLRPFFPLLLPVLAWRALAPSPERSLSYVLQVARLRQLVVHRITIGFVGSPSTGKDAAIKALFGIDSGNISPVAGSTKTVQSYTVPGSTALYIVNTPGLGDVVEAVTEEAKQILDHIDVYVYLVNAEGGVQAREKADYQRCVATRKPVLAVVNKVDVLRPRDKDKYLADAREKLGAPAEDFLSAAFDPLPQLSPTPIGREAVHAWLAAHLAELGKDPKELPAIPTPSAPQVHEGVDDAHEARPADEVAQGDG